MFVDNQLDEARLAVAQALMRDARSRGAHLLRGKIHMKMERYEQAAVDFSQELELDQGCVEAAELLTQVKNIATMDDLGSIHTTSDTSTTTHAKLAEVAAPRLSGQQFEAAASEISQKPDRLHGIAVEPPQRKCFLDVYKPLAKDTDVSGLAVKEEAHKLVVAFASRKARTAAARKLNRTQPAGTVCLVPGPRSGRRVRLPPVAPGEYYEHGPFGQGLPQKPFRRVVKEIMQDMGSDIKFQSGALQVLREVSELMLTQLFEDAQTICTHAKRKTLFVTDVILAKNCARTPLALQKT